MYPVRRSIGVVVGVDEEVTPCGIIVIPISCNPFAMANLLVRNLDDDVLKELKAAAKAHGRSLQAEIHEVLRNASARRLAETRRLSARWLKRLGGSTHSDSAALIREDRDTR
jgi:plasmid stability protein